MMIKNAPIAFLCAYLLACAQSVAPETGATDGTLSESACSNHEASTDPWHITNLYDCHTMTVYVPYHLWTGMAWDGTKEGSCMHNADTEFRVNGTSLTHNKGPIEWRIPVTDTTEAVWVRSKADGSKTQYFTCHDKGVGRVFDQRVGRDDRHWATGRCKFPAGHGWKLRERRDCGRTAIEITEIGTNDDGSLTHLTFKWWTGDTLDHIYRYEPEYGMTHAWPQS